jgi:hypothetical protein
MVPGCTPILSSGRIGFLDNCVVYAVACWSGISLGLDSENHAEAYMGWARPVFAFFGDNERDYATDWADMFTVFPILAANGSPMLDCFAAFRRKCDDYISYYKSVAIDLRGSVQSQAKMGKFRNADYYVSRTMSNRDGSILLGDAGYAMN